MVAYHKGAWAEGGVSCCLPEGNVMKLARRQLMHFAAGVAAFPAASRIARAQTYPSRPVRIIVGAAPGGSQDIAARLIGQWLSERLGRQFIVENRTGGGRRCRDRGGREGSSRRIHAALGRPAECDRCDTLREAQFRLSSRYCAGREHGQRPLCHDGASIASGAFRSRSSPTGRPMRARSITVQDSTVQCSTWRACCSR
jgi:hypothetical protein